MNLLLLTAYFPPENGSASHLFFDLAESLVKMGHSVSVLTGFPRYHVEKQLTKHKHKLFMNERINGIHVLRTRLFDFPARIHILRGLHHFYLSFTFILRGLFTGKADAVIVYSPPLPLCLTAYFLSKLKRASFILNLQDLFPQSAIDLGALKSKRLIKAFRIIERFVYRKADGITVHSEGNKEYVLRQAENISRDKIEVIPNWVDTDTIRPETKLNGFRNKHCISHDTFVVSFAGIIGYSQDMNVIIDSAIQLKNHKNILFLIVGGGTRREDAENRTLSNRLNNIMFLPMQSREYYPKILGASDVCLVTLKKDVKTPVVPSKIMSIMSSGRPIIACLNLNGDAPKLIKESGAGFCVSPENSGHLTEAILNLFNNRDLCNEIGQSARKYAEEHLSRAVCVNKYNQLIQKLS